MPNKLIRILSSNYRKKDYNIIIDGSRSFDQTVKSNIKTSKYWKDCCWAMLHKWLFVRLSLFPKIFWDNFSRFKETTSTPSWSKRNTANVFYWKYREECNNGFYSWRSKKIYFGFFSRNHERIWNLFSFNIILASVDSIQ